MTLRAVIVGRPNVGKSTFFNRLSGKREALVHDLPGVTRDLRETKVSILGTDVLICDTAGFEEAATGTLENQMFLQTKKAVAEADIVLFMFDARIGITPQDKLFADIVRVEGKPIIVLANKSEAKDAKTGYMEAFSLGFGDPICISAEHGLGITDFFSSLVPFLDKEDEKKEDSEEKAAPDEILQLAIVGRPNVGKSTLVNALLNDERMLTSDIAGTTRDAIPVDWQWRDQKIRLVDTAGIRKNAKVYDPLEKLSVFSAMKAVDFAQVVILVLDADMVLDKQDLQIARKVVEEGRALVIAVNKWDNVKDKNETLQKLNDKLQTSLAQISGVPVVMISALKKSGLGKLMENVFNVYKLWNKRVSTAKLNQWFKEMIEKHPPPRGKHAKLIKLKYITQASARPPTFVIFSSNPENLPESYNRYLINGLSETFKLKGIPIRIFVRKSDNPYNE
ncbi:MAG: ribosome biogenesis GTPase Der [Alphaproteobacteria bacterium]